MEKFLRKMMFFVIISLLLSIGGFLSYMAYIDINCSAAKQYLVDKYNLNKKSLHSKNYTEYVYEDITDCSTLWLKKCSDDKDLVYSYTFELDNDVEIIVKQDVKGNYSDDYKTDIIESNDKNTEQIDTTNNNELEKEKNE